MDVHSAPIIFNSATAIIPVMLGKFTSSSQVMTTIAFFPLQRFSNKNYDPVSKFLTFSSSLIVRKRNLQLVRILH